MFPSDLPGDRKITRSEARLFDELKLRLPDEYYVYFAVPFIEGERATQGEVDFIILHPEKGMLFVEVKGGGVERGEDGRWYRKNGKRLEAMSESPIEQVKKQLESLVTKFRSPLRQFTKFHGRFPMVYGWALAFPFTATPDRNVPPDVEEEIYFDAEILDDPKRVIDAAFDFWSRKHDGRIPEISDEAFHRFRKEVLSPEIRFVPNLGGALAVERAELRRLSESQAALAQMFIANRRLKVHGGAGTGKTVLALHCARLLANQGKDVLFLCFNRALGEHLSDLVREQPTADGSIYATNFHRLCSRAAEALGTTLDVPDGYDAQRDYWVHEAPLVLWEAISEGKLGPWDAVIVDEGQDFARDWWTILDCGVAPDGSMAIFYDASQSLFEHGGELPDFGHDLPLVHNYRNTRAIAEVLNVLLPTKTLPHEFAPDGEPPTVVQQQGPTWTCRKLGELMHGLMSKHGIKYHQMAILTPRTPKNSVLEGATELEGVPIVHKISEREVGVIHTTIAGFKGLEAEIVFFLDVDPAHERCSVKARYVAASRARHRLYVFEKDDWLRI